MNINIEDDSNIFQEILIFSFWSFMDMILMQNES